MWTFNTARPFAGEGLNGPVIGSDGTLKVATDYTVFAVSGASGAELWSYTDQNAFFSPKLSLSGNGVLLVGGSESLFAFGRTTGTATPSATALAVSRSVSSSISLSPTATLSAGAPPSASPTMSPRGPASWAGNVHHVGAILCATGLISIIGAIVTVMLVG